MLVGAVVNSRGETIRASDDEDKAAGINLLLFQPTGKLDAAILASVFIKEYNGIGGLQLFENELAFGLFLLFFAKALCILQFRNGDYVKGHVVVDALHVVVDADYEVLVHRFPYLNQYSLHGYWLLAGCVESFKVVVATQHHATVDVTHPIRLGKCECQSDDDKHQIGDFIAEDGLQQHDNSDRHKEADH